MVTGRVLFTNSPSHDPNAMVRLAANPEPAEKRIEAVKTTLASVQQKLAPAKSNLDKALQAVAAAKKPLEALDQKVAALRKQAVESEAAAKQTTELSAKFDQTLPTLSTSIRDLQDEVTALARWTEIRWLQDDRRRRGGKSGWRLSCWISPSNVAIESR